MTTTGRTVPLICLSDNLAELNAAFDAAQTRVGILGAAVDAADAFGDDAAYKRAFADYDRAGDELLLIERRIEELGQDRADDERRERNREFWGAVL